jgi:hypothetical protein
LKDLKILKTGGRGKFKIAKLKVDEEWKEFLQKDFGAFVEEYKKEIHSLLMGEAIKEEEIPDGYNDDLEEVEADD